MRTPSPLARFAAAVRSRYTRGFGRRAPLTPVVLRGPKPALAMAVHRHLHIGISALWPVVHRRLERHVLTAPARPAGRSVVTRMMVVERLLTRRQRVEPPASRAVVGHLARPAPAPSPPVAPSASPLPARPSPAAAAGRAAPPVTPDVERLAADVIRAIDRRVIAQRERLGRT
jgi:hypothetical protein